MQCREKVHGYLSWFKNNLECPQGNVKEQNMNRQKEIAWPPKTYNDEHLV